MIPRTMTFRGIAVFTSIGAGSEVRPMMINNSTFTFSRLSGSNSLPLTSRLTVNPVTSDLNGAVVNCFEGSMSTDSVARTTIRIIDPGQFGKKIIIILSIGRMGSCSLLSIRLQYIVF